jgi:hypothetical protein
LRFKKNIIVRIIGTAVLIFARVTQKPLQKIQPLASEGRQRRANTFFATVITDSHRE